MSWFARSLASSFTCLIFLSVGFKAVAAMLCPASANPKASFTVVVCLHIAEAEAEAKEKINHLRFYFHDIVSRKKSRKNVTAVKVASAPITNSFATLFGTVMVMDDWLTEGPEATSKMVGRAQAIYVSLSQEKFHY